MNDSKYGRLYPERAVAPLRQAIEELIEDGRLDRVTHDDLRSVLAEHNELGFPPDEPLFLLRGQDVLAPETVIFYASLVDARDAFAHLDLGHFKEFADRMRAWEPRKLPD